MSAGCVLCDLHLDYETAEPYRLDGLDVGPTSKKKDAAHEFSG